MKLPQPVNSNYSEGMGLEMKTTEAYETVTRLAGLSGQPDDVMGDVIG